MLFFFALFLVFPAPVLAETIVTIGPDVFLSRQVLTPDCEYIDLFEYQISTTSRSFIPGETEDVRLAQKQWTDELWQRRLKSEIHGFPNPCYYNKDGTWTDDPPDYCPPTHHLAWLQTPGNGGSGSEVSTTTINYGQRQSYVNLCDGHDCEPPVVVPEPSTITFAILGLVFLIGWGWKQRDSADRVAVRNGLGSYVKRWQFGYFFPEEGTNRRWPGIRLEKHRLTLFVGRLGFVYLDWDPEFVCPDCLFSRSMRQVDPRDDRLIR